MTARRFALASLVALSAALSAPLAHAAPVVAPVVAPSPIVRAYVCLETLSGWSCDRVVGDNPAPQEEDSPAWDCRLHGNQQCGEGAILPNGYAATPGQYRLVVLRG